MEKRNRIKKIMDENSGDFPPAFDDDICFHSGSYNYTG